MVRFGRVLGIVGLVSLLSVPLTLFLWDWRFTWVALAKIVFGSAGVVFWLSTNLRGVRETFQGRSTFYGIFAGLFVAIALVAVVVANYVFHKYPYQIDLTEEKIHSLSDQSSRVLEALEADVLVTAFYGPKEEREFNHLSDMLERYRYVSDRFVYEFIDPLIRQDLAEKHKIHLGGPRILLEHRGRQERVRLGDPAYAGTEEAITAALLKITVSGSRRKVCFLTGHGEKALKGEDPRSSLSRFVRDLEGEGYGIDTISLLAQAEVPPACQLVVLVGPKEALIPDEAHSLKRYLDTGGRALVFLGVGDTTSLDALLKQRGVLMGKDAIIYPRGRSPLEVVTEPRHYPRSHPVFSRFFAGGGARLGQLQAIFPLARSVRSSLNPPEGLTLTELAASSDEAWAETDGIQEGEAVEVTFDKGKDRPGPVPMVVTVAPRRSSPGAEPPVLSRLAVFGSSLMVVNTAYQLYPFNRNLVMNTVAWLIQEEKKISIRPRSRAASLLRLDESEMKFITFFSTDILPLLILALGITIWQLRRWS